jgi:hypothetical protein
VLRNITAKNSYNLKVNMVRVWGWSFNDHIMLRLERERESEEIHVLHTAIIGR